MLRFAATPDPRKNTPYDAPNNPKPIADATGVRPLALRRRPKRKLPRKTPPGSLV